ncbi:MAG TPA: GDSL-type esterase/lipase family protein [Pseudonocardiaceae bacterium]|nr:GDSL-type esterase/lipase family protein [Pseudonocardiaceae bacterium]
MSDSARPLRVVCVGDSITRGQVSVDYVDLLRKRRHTMPTEFVNAGVNYDLAYSIRTRLDRVTAHQPDIVCVLVGTNDANATLGASNRRLVTLLKRPPSRPTAPRFADDLTAIARDLSEQTNARVGLLSLPVIGEDLDSAPLRRATEYSAIVREVAAATNADYLPLHERQLEYLRAQPNQPRTHYRPGLGLSTRASIQHFLLRRTLDDISARRGLSLTTDTIHQNSHGATLIADVITEFLTRVATSTRRHRESAQPVE